MKYILSSAKYHHKDLFTQLQNLREGFHIMDHIRQYVVNMVVHWGWIIAWDYWIDLEMVMIYMKRRQSDFTTADYSI